MISIVIQTLSAGRFSTYLTASGHAQDRAVRLYIWNAYIGEAFHTPIQTVEIALRNAVNRALVASYGQNWWESTNFLSEIDSERSKDLIIVKTRIKNRNLDMVTDQIVAGLSLGFWIGMLQPRYNPKIWSAHLRTAFPYLPESETRDSICKAASRTANLRNRISHHEPIFNRDLLKDFATMMTLLKWICPSTHDWIKPYCRVTELMRQKPK